MNKPTIFALLNDHPLPELQHIEVFSSLQIPSFHIVGLPGPEVSEARERVRAAILASKLDFPKRRVVLNLSPASVRKQGTGLDLPMALSILMANKKSSRSLLAWGELGLDGSLRSAGHTGRALYAAWKHQIELLVLPAEERPALARISALIRASASFPHEPPAVLFARNLEEAWKGIDHGESLPETYETTPRVSEPETLLQLPPPLTRALGIAAACNHHLLLLGPRGTGKSRTLEWLKALQPAQSPEHMLTRSLLAEMNGENIASNVRCVGSQVRPAALLGTMTGGALRSGEFALAHGGILIADELPEWPRDSRETLREPLETGRVTLTRAHGSVEFPAAFQFAANGNFCPCGGWPPEWPAPISGRWTKCICGERERRIYLRRLSGPVLDRIDLVLGVRDIGDTTPGLTPVTALKERVIKTRETAHKIWGNPPGRLSAEQTELIIKQLGNNTEKALKRAPNFRSRHKLMRVALSLALWDGEDRPAEHHFDEAALYRPEALGIGTCIEPTA